MSDQQTFKNLRKIGVIEMSLYSLGDDSSGPLRIGVLLPKYPGNDALQSNRRKITDNSGTNGLFSHIKIKGNMLLFSYLSNSENRHLISEDLKANILKHGNCVIKKGSISSKLNKKLNKTLP